MEQRAISQNFYEEEREGIKEEWVDGVKYMSPSPSPSHGVVYSKIFNSIYNYLEDKNCRLFPDKTDLILRDYRTKKKDISVYEYRHPTVPDMFVVCDERYEEFGNNIVAIPDFIVEVVSPSSDKLDYEIKRKKYLDCGVKEYWVVNAELKRFLVIFDGKEYEYSFEDKVKVNIFDDLEIDLSKIKLSKYDN